MHQAKKGSTWLFGIKAHVAVDAESGLVHSVVGMAANVADVTQAGALLHGDETHAFGYPGYRGVGKRKEAEGPQWRCSRGNAARTSRGGWRSCSSKPSSSRPACARRSSIHSMS